jgi:hypothetical protein
MPSEGDKPRPGVQFWQKRLGFQIASQLPDDYADAVAVLDFVRFLIDVQPTRESNAGDPEPQALRRRLSVVSSGGVD